VRSSCVAVFLCVQISANGDVKQASKATHGLSVNYNEAWCECAPFIDWLLAANLIFIQRPLTLKYT
jgi:hypothetical protein